MLVNDSCVVQSLVWQAANSFKKQVKHLMPGLYASFLQVTIYYDQRKQLLNAKGLFLFGLCIANKIAAWHDFFCQSANQIFSQSKIAYFSEHLG